MVNPYAAPDAELSDASPGDGTYQPRMFAMRGRIGRLRYLAYSLGFGVLISVIGDLLVMLLHYQGTAEASVSILTGLLMLVAIVVLAKRRFNDFDSSGGLAVLTVIPFLNFLVWLYLLFRPGTDGPNNYGAAPAANSRGIVLAALVLPLIVIIGIAAAIAIPAYQKYVDRGGAGASSYHR